MWGPAGRTVGRVNPGRFVYLRAHFYLSWGGFLEIEHVTDVMALMKQVADAIGPEDKYYKEFIKFSTAFPGVLGEYYGMLLNFLEEVLDRGIAIPMKKDLLDLDNLCRTAFHMEKRDV